MPKPNTYLLLKQAEREIQQLKLDLYYAKGFTIQQCIDMAMIALNEEFSFGPVANKRFEKKFREAFIDYAELCVSDGKDDAELVYTKAALDRDLVRAYGSDLLPFDERYALDRMYLWGDREGREKWKDETNGKNT